MYQEFKKKEDAQKVAKEGKYYTFNLDTFRIFSIGSFFLFIVSLIFLFGYWLGSLSINLNSNENLTSSIQNEKVLSKVPSPEQSVINLSDDDQQVKIQEPKESSSFIDEKFQDFKNVQNNSLKTKEDDSEKTVENVKKITENAIKKEKLAVKKEIAKTNLKQDETKSLKKKENKNKENKENKKGEELKKGGYQVQVSVNRKKEYAIALKEKLILKGYHAYIYESESNNIPIYIVYIGPFVKMEDAQDTKKYLEQDFKNLSGSYILKN